MFKPYPLFVGFRHFRSAGENRLVSFISFLAITGLVIGVALLIVVMSIMNGFDRELETRILNTVPHIRILSTGGIQNWQLQSQVIARHDNVISVTPFSELEGMLSYRSKVHPVLLRGVLTDAENQGIRRGQSDVKSLLPTSFIDSSLLDKLYQADKSGVLLTKGVADKLQVESGSRVTLLLPKLDNKGRQHIAPSIKQLTVLGVFETHTALDQSLIIGDINTVNRLAGLEEKPQGLQVQLADLFTARSTGYELLNILPPGHQFSDWVQTHGNLYQAINMSRNMVSLLVLLIIAIAVFNVISMLVMTVIEKRPAIAILKTLGASNMEIVITFLSQGVLIGVAGSLLGAMLGVVLALNISSITMLIESVFDVSLMSSEIYPVDYLPSVLVWSDVGLVVFIAMLLNILATLYPAWKAARTRPVEVLRYE